MGDQKSETSAASPLQKLVIKHCPFCGGNMYIKKGNFGTYMPLCSNIECIAGDDGAYAPSEEEAIKLCNKRAL
jgi:ssDNA-binding Zn-finger/Zn-ribbon topoisomerase 1